MLEKEARRKNKEFSSKERCMHEDPKAGQGLVCAKT